MVPLPPSQAFLKIIGEQGLILIVLETRQREKESEKRVRGMMGTSAEEAGIRKGDLFF